MIKSGKGQTYADILGTIKDKVNPEALDTEIKSVRRTRMGDVLVELGTNTRNKENFCEALRGALGETATVRSLEPKITLEIRDLDCLSTEEEVKAAIQRDLKDYTGELKVSVTKTNAREQRMAFVEIGPREAHELLKIGRIKIGWLYCRVGRRTVVTRCYACFGFGHHQATCKGPNRKEQGICIQCGEKGHIKKDCQSEPKCFLCAKESIGPEQLKHVAGSGACKIFRQALDKIRIRNIK